MGYAIALAALLITGSTGAVVALRRSRADRGPSELDAEAEANRWLIRLGVDLIPPGAADWASAGETAGRALTDAAHCHRTARALLAEASTAAEYEHVTRTAQDGLRHVDVARENLGLPTHPTAAAQPQVRQVLPGALLDDGSKPTAVSAHP